MNFTSVKNQTGGRIWPVGHSLPTFESTVFQTAGQDPSVSWEINLVVHNQQFSKNEKEWKRTYQNVIGSKKLLFHEMFVSVLYIRLGPG